MNFVRKALVLEKINQQITQCKKCPRLRAHCQKIGKEKRKAYAQETYWAKPVPGWGDAKAKLVIVGLAPAAHGANRTGRMFTGDRSGEWLYRALFKSGFANQAESTGKKDGLKLRNVYITAAAKCAPPDNKPTPEELKRCRETFLEKELEVLNHAEVYLALGQIAFIELWRAFQLPPKERPKFSHSLETKIGDKALLLSYHPSQQNTFTKRLTEPMFDRVFQKANALSF